MSFVFSSHILTSHIIWISWIIQRTFFHVWYTGVKCTSEIWLCGRMTMKIRPVFKLHWMVIGRSTTGVREDESEEKKDSKKNEGRVIVPCVRWGNCWLYAHIYITHVASPLTVSPSINVGGCDRGVLWVLLYFYSTSSFYSLFRSGTKNGRPPPPPLP